MDTFDKNMITAIDIGDGWTARVRLCGQYGRRFSPDDWRRCLDDPQALTGDPQTVIRDSTSARVIIKTIQPGVEPITVVIKDELVKGGFKGFFRSFQPAKSKRNFRTAQKLLQNQIPVVIPLAALEKKKGPRTVRSIYITDYSKDSNDMHNFIRDNIGKINFADPAIKKQFLVQSVTILAMLDRYGMWHRDAKAGNFLADFSDGNYRIRLLDMDGIKHCRLKLLQNKLRIRTIAKLVSTLLWNPFVTRSDYLRTLTLYCNLAGISKDKRKKLFKEISKTAVAMRLVTMVRASRSAPKE